MIRPRLRAYLPITRPTSFFHFNRPLLSPKLALPRLRWQIQWTSKTPRHIDAKYFSTALQREIEEIIPPRSVGYWLLGTAGLVFGIVVVGGLTRLTESGYSLSCITLTCRLSITEWKPVTGIIPPRTENAWILEFEKYKSTPEYQILNPRMSLHDFKSIYYMEYTHRLLGRVIGLAFVFPAAYYIARGKVSRRFGWALGGIGLLIGFQGFLGWWMVKSGLKKEELLAQDGVPRVSQYRLAAHLGTAFGVYSIMILMGLSVLRKNRFLRMDSLTRNKWVESLSTIEVKRFRGKTVGLLHMVFITVLSGVSPWKLLI
jgi:heme a synthase